ncbi:MAG: nicotinate-nucleotide adenylyltransferase [Lentisphaerae bacterium]|nr:nicotinate-nucleotide adenylyltransferase [Lentisphaerota bacterium]
MKQKIGIFGGTFNPVHLGHLIMAQDALEAFELSKVLFVPSSKPPHKTGTALAPAEHRAAMLLNALERSTHFEVCEMELVRGGTSYTVDTLRELRKKYVDRDLFFIIGSDSLTELHTWKEINQILELCTIVTMARPGYDPISIKYSDINLPDPWPERLLTNVISMHQLNISSSDIRHRIAEGMRISHLLPQSVDSYISEHRLYRL